MKRISSFGVFVALFLGMNLLTLGQSRVTRMGRLAGEGRTTFTGTVLSYGSGFNTRTSVNTFTLNINGTTSDADAARYLNTLQEGRQDALLDAIRNQNLGTFSIGSQVGRTLNVVRVSNVDGRQRILAVFERWLGMGELRGGYRSIDYPFGYIELFIDPRTGKGEGTFISAAQIRFKHDNKSGQNQVEIEDFGTYPSRLMNVTMRGTRLQ